MLKVIKYEWLRRWKLFLAGIVTFLAANMSLMSNFLEGIDSPRTHTAILMLLCVVLAVVLFIDHVGRLYRTLFSDEGYLEFSVPLRGYQLLAGKLLAVIVETVGVLAIISLTFSLDALYFAKVTGEPFSFSVSLGDWWTLIRAILIFLVVYTSFLTTVYLSMTLAKTVFAPFKRGKLIAFCCFLALSRLLGAILEEASPIVESAGRLSDLFYTDAEWFITAALLLVLYLTTSYLLDRRLNL